MDDTTRKHGDEAEKRGHESAETEEHAGFVETVDEALAHLFNPHHAEDLTVQDIKRQREANDAEQRK